MTKDDRLYARFDINMDENPKIMGLSDAAFRAYFESIFYSRRQLSDGELKTHVVRKKWSDEVAAELASNDPERPSWIETPDGWRIHDFEKHQTTTADIEAKREAGRLGGLAKASKKVAPATDLLKQKASTTLAKTETETETETPSSTKRDGRASRIPEPFILTKAMREWAADELPRMNVDVETRQFVDYWRARSGATATKRDWVAAWRYWLRKDAKAAVPTKRSKEDQLVDVLEQGRMLMEQDTRKALE